MAVTTAIIGAVAAVAGAGAAIYNTVETYKPGGTADRQDQIANENLALQKAEAELNARGQISSIDKEIAELEGNKIQYGIDIRDAQSQLDSYDKWLGNYGAQYAQEVQSKQAQTDALKASGKETYENFLNAIGYADAMAGATGRVGAGTSQAQTTSMLDRKLVDYVGADRTLDANGGLFGTQLTAANMEMDQLKTDLEFQRYEMEQNRKNTELSIGDYNEALKITDASITKSNTARNELEDFINENFK